MKANFPSLFLWPLETMTISLFASFRRLLGLRVDDRYVASNNELFEYFRGRFLLNENEQMAKHRIRFNLHELASTAADSIGSTRCIGIENVPRACITKLLPLPWITACQLSRKFRTSRLVSPTRPPPARSQQWILPIMCFRFLRRKCMPRKPPLARREILLGLNTSSWKICQAFNYQIHGTIATQAKAQSFTSQVVRCMKSSD